MSEQSFLGPEDSNSIETYKYQEQARHLFEMVEQMSELVEPAPEPEEGIEKWFKMDIPAASFDSITARDCNGTELVVHKFEARLHEQDSAHQVWEFKFLNNSEDTRQVRGMLIKGKTGFEFLLSEVEQGGEERVAGAFKTATPEMASNYYEEYMYHLYSEVREIAAGYMCTGFDNPDSPGQVGDWENAVQFWAEDGATVPGLMENGHIIDKKA